jgi:hypothetical protein
MCDSIMKRVRSRGTELGGSEVLEDGGKEASEGIPSCSISCSWSFANYCVPQCQLVLVLVSLKLAPKPSSIHQRTESKVAVKAALVACLVRPRSEQPHRETITMLSFPIP